MGHLPRVVAACALVFLPGPRPATAQPAATDVRTIEVTAEQFRFVPSQIQVVEGETVRLRLRSLDVPHGLAIPDLGVAVTARPGQEGSVEFVAETPGRYAFACSVFCGVGHSGMTGTLEVIPAGGAPAAERIAGGPDDPETDVVLLTLPTTMPLPTNRLAFRLAHRFSRPLDGGEGFGNLLEDFFGFDAAALIGLELRYGVTSRLQVGVHRNNTRNIQLFGRYGLLRPDTGRGTGVDAFVSIEGLNNFREEHAPAVGAIVSQRLGRAVVYAQPLWMENVDNGDLLHPQSDPYEKTDDDAFVVGLGTRVQVLDTVFVVADYLPRLTGFDQGEDYLGVAVEKQVGGHVFQVNFANSVGTTPGQLAQGGSTSWFIGFNISRRFY